MIKKKVHGLKRGVSPKEARRYLRTVTEGGKQFYAHDGRVLKNLWDLYAYLKNCEESEFRHHVDGSKNDLAAWVRNVIKDEDLASYMDYCLARGAMANRLLGRINLLVMISTKKAVGPKKAEMLLEEARVPEELFITSDGRAIRNLWEMLDFIKTAKEEAFAHHVNEHKNDIAVWVEDIVLDTELSDKIRGASNREEMHRILHKRIKDLERLASPRKKSITADAMHAAQLVSIVRS
jgi:hypothetical protein